MRRAAPPTRAVRREDFGEPSRGGLSAAADTVRTVDLGDAYKMAAQLLEQHGLDDWEIEFDNAKRRAGVCRYARRVIGLSAPLTRLHPVDEVRETILHEIAHALVGPQHGHDQVWAAQAKAIGSNAVRCVPSDAPKVPAPWLGVCASGHSKERHKRPERVESCGRCSATFSSEHVFQWTFQGRPASMHPNYVAELRRLELGRSPAVVRIGDRGRITAPGAFHGRIGTVVKRGRTSYHLDLPEGRLRVLFAAVEPV